MMTNCDQKIGQPSVGAAIAAIGGWRSKFAAFAGPTLNVRLRQLAGLGATSRSFPNPAVRCDQLSQIQTEPDTTGAALASGVAAVEKARPDAPAAVQARRGRNRAR